MRLDFKNRLQLKNQARELEELEENNGKELEDNWEKSMVQYNLDDEMEGDNNMRLDKKEQTDEELKEELRRNNLRNFPSMSNKSSNQEQIWEFTEVNVNMRDRKPYSFQVSLSVDQLAEYYNNGIFYYDPTLQRGCTYDKKENMKPLITLKHVKQILTSMTDRKMIHGGEILLNYAKEHPTQLLYNPETRTLSGNGVLAICDGGHRLESCRMWYKTYKRNPDTTKLPQEFSYNVTIFYLNHDEAEQLFVEANSLSKPISKTRIAYHDVFNPNRKIIDILEDQSLLKGKIESMSGTIKKSSNKIVTYKMLLDNVSQFKVATPKEAEETGLYLTEFWNELINLFPKAMGNVDPETRLEQRKQSFILENMFIAGYFTLANKLRDVDNWKDKLKKLNENDFLSRSNPTFSFCLTEDNKIANSSKIQKRVGEKMIEYVMEE